MTLGRVESRVALARYRTLDSFRIAMMREDLIALP